MVTPEDACPVWGSNLQWKLSITSVFLKLEHFARFKENKSRKDLGEITNNGTVKMWNQGCDWFCLSCFPWQPLYSSPGQSSNLDNYIFLAKFLPPVSVGWDFSFFLIWTTCRLKLSSAKQLLHFIPGRLPLMDLAVWHWGPLNWDVSTWSEYLTPMNQWQNLGTVKVGFHSSVITISFEQVTELQFPFLMQYIYSLWYKSFFLYCGYILIQMESRSQINIKAKQIVPIALNYQVQRNS